MALPIYMVSNREYRLNNPITTNKNSIRYENIRNNLTPTLLENYIISNLSTNDIRSNYLSFIEGLEYLCAERECGYRDDLNNSQIHKMITFIGENVIPSLRSKELSSLNNKIHKTTAIPVEYVKMLESYINNIEACDRVINNDRKLSTRFNINKISNNNKSINALVQEMCELIDTYNIKENVKMNVALENTCYTLYKSKKYDQPTIVSEVVDYFLTREPVISDYKYKGYQNIIKYNIFLDESSIKTVERLLDEDHIYFIDMINSMKSITENKNIHQAIDLLPTINSEDKAGKYIKALAELYEDCCLDCDKAIISNILNGLPLFTNCISHDFINTYMEILNDKYSLKGEFVEDSTLMKQATTLENAYKNIKTSNNIDTITTLGLLEKFLYEQNKDITKLDTIIESMSQSEKIQTLPTIIKYKGKMYNNTLNDNTLIEYIKEIVSDCTTTYQIDQIDNILKPMSDVIPDNEELKKFRQNTLPMYKDAIDVDYDDQDNNLADIVYGMKICEIFDKTIKENKKEIIDTINTIIPYIISDAETMNEFMNIVSMCPHIISLQEIAEMNKDIPQNVIESTNLKNATLYNINESNLFINEDDAVYDLNIELETASFLINLNEGLIKDTINKAGEKIQKVGEKFKKQGQKSSEEIEKKGFTGFSIYKFKLAMKAFWSKMKKLSAKEKQFCQNLDATTSKLYETIKDYFVDDRREMLIKGQVIPSFSKCVRNAIAMAGVIGAGTVLAGGISSLPVVAPVVLLGKFAMDKKLTDREKNLLYDELDTELKVLEKEINIAENDGDMNKYRFLLNYQKRIIREKQRIKYNLKPNHNRMSTNLH